MGGAPRLRLHADPDAGVLGLELGDERLHRLRLGAHRPELDLDLARRRAAAAAAEHEQQNCNEQIHPSLA